MDRLTQPLVDKPVFGIEFPPKSRDRRSFSISYSSYRRTMTVFFKRRFVRRICLGTVICGLLVLAFIFIVIPFIFRYSYSIQRNILFLNMVKMPNVNYNQPAKLGLVGARSLHIKTDDDVRLGVWHMLPVNHQLKAVARNWLSGNNQDMHAQYDRWMRDEVTIIYCHGNAGTRATDHRVRLYKLLNELNYHVVAFDYRGYADSSSTITDEQGVVKDAKAVIEWVRQRVTSGHVFVWGHSLGTAVASHALAELEGEGKRVTGVVLEAPFNNLSDEIRVYPLSQLFRFLPWFDFMFVDPVYDNMLRFESDVNLRNVSVPVMILHAKDDMVVPYELGQKLYQSVLSSRKDNKTLQFISFDSKYHHGHKFIYRDKQIPSLVRKFVNDSVQSRKL